MCIEDSQIAMFADDTTIIKSKQNAKSLSDSDIGHTPKWFVDNKLAVNVEKRDAMVFGSKQS